MSDTTKLPALLRLYDDDSETVRETVARELASFGDDLEELIRALPEPPDDPTIVAVLETVKGAPDTQDTQDTQDEQTSDVESTAGSVDETTQRFREGQLVRHKRYGYRGVVVSIDTECQASDAWYDRNRTQPDREQPWYHVLVDGSDQVTYAAQTSLLPDESMAPVVHPLLPFFFEETDDGRFVRNARPWPTVE